MGVHHFTQLIAWQLADDIRREVLAYTAKSPCRADRRFCSDARASLAETQDHLISAFHGEHVDEETFHRIWQLTVRAIKANEGLQRYLADCIASGFSPNL